MIIFGRATVRQSSTVLQIFDVFSIFWYRRHPFKVVLQIFDVFTFYDIQTPKKLPSVRVPLLYSLRLKLLYEALLATRTPKARPGGFSKKKTEQNWTKFIFLGFF